MKDISLTGGTSTEGHVRPDLTNRFTYHQPTPEQVTRYEQIREAGLHFSQLVQSLTPVSREQSLALTNVDYAILMANASIARNE